MSIGLPPVGWMIDSRFILSFFLALVVAETHNMYPVMDLRDMIDGENCISVEDCIHKLVEYL